MRMANPQNLVHLGRPNRRNSRRNSSRIRVTETKFERETVLRAPAQLRVSHIPQGTERPSFRRCAPVRRIRLEANLKTTTT